MDFKNKVAVVTGGSKGIGKAIARSLAQAGSRVVITARNQAELTETAKELSSNGSQILPVVMDVRDPAQVSKAAGETREKFGAADILINNAGIGIFNDVLTMKHEEFQAVIETNLYGVFYCTQAFLPGMIEKNEGCIINISSLAGKNNFAGGSVYCASKHALNSFAECLMLEIRKHNIKVSTICPGSVATDFSPESAQKSWALTSEDVAEAVMAVLNGSPGSLMSLIEMRPLNPKK